jgi:hypothetical protein
MISHGANHSHALMATSGIGKKKVVLVVPVIQELADDKAGLAFDLLGHGADPI